MTPDELGKLFFDIKCSPRGEQFWKAMRERCLVDVPLELTQTGPKGELVLNISAQVSPTYIAMLMAKQSVFHDMERWARHGEEWCRKESAK